MFMVKIKLKVVKIGCQFLKCTVYITFGEFFLNSDIIFPKRRRRGQRKLFTHEFGTDTSRLYSVPKLLSCSSAPVGGEARSQSMTKAPWASSAPWKLLNFLGTSFPLNWQLRLFPSFAVCWRYVYHNSYSSSPFYSLHFSLVGLPGVR